MTRRRDSELDAVVIGSGPNGLVAAITLAQAGRSVRVVEAAATPGGGMRTHALTLPDVRHDVCSTVHPLALASTALRSLPLASHGLEWVHPETPLAHPLDGARAAVLTRSVTDTAAVLGASGAAYRRIMQPLVDAGFDLVDGLLSPLALPPRHPVTLARYGRFGIRSAASLSRVFATDEASALLAGLAGHSMLPLSSASTAGYGLFLGMLGHLVGWPVARGGSQSIADALVSLLSSLGGNVECGWEVQSLDELPPSRAVLADVTPRQLLAIAGNRLPARYRKKLQRFRYGPGVHKVDWVLDGPVPWLSPACHAAGTVHVGGAFEQVAAAEEEVSRGRHPERPFVLLVQPSQCDGTRSPTGMHVVWAYCHVPNGSTVDMTERIEAQIERFAPGFRDRILARHVMGPAAMQTHNPNYVGGDINGGLADLRQFVARPTFGLHPWATPVAGLYLCSSSTPPGGGVHGMCGWHAAKEVLRQQK